MCAAGLAGRRRADTVRLPARYSNPQEGERNAVPSIDAVSGSISPHPIECACRAAVDLSLATVMGPGYCHEEGTTLCHEWSSYVPSCWSAVVPLVMDGFWRCRCPVPARRVRAVQASTVAQI